MAAKAWALTELMLKREQVPRVAQL